MIWYEQNRTERTLYLIYVEYDVFVVVISWVVSWGVRTKSEKRTGDFGRDKYYKGKERTGMEMGAVR